MNDRNLIALCIKNPRQGFPLLMDIHQENIYKYVRACVLSHEDTCDIVQNTFIKVWKGLSGFQYKSSLSTWIHRIAINETHNFLKKRNRYTSLDVEAILRKEIAQNYFDEDEAMLKLHKAIATLPDRQKEVFVMRYFQELPYKEIALILELSIGGIKTNFHLARKKIESYIKQELNLLDFE